MAEGVGDAMGVVERMARKVLADGVNLDQHDVAAHASQLLPVEAPLLEATEVGAIVDTVLGFGPLEQLLRDPQVSDILVNGDGVVWVEKGGALHRTGHSFARPEQMVAAIERVIAPLGLRLDRASPAVDARLGDGSRLHAVIPPASLDGPVLAIRRFTPVAATLDELVQLGSLTQEGAEVVRRLVHGRKNLLVCGPTGSGKTTLLNVLSHEIPDGERVVTVEDAAELQLTGHVVRLEGRPANVEGAGAITLRQLLRHALRLRPDRIVVGEVRGAEAFDMIQAMSTGHEGSMSTIHAGSAEEAVWRLETLALLEPSATPEAIRRQVERVIDAVVVAGRKRQKRVVRSVQLFGDEPGEVYSCS